MWVDSLHSKVSSQMSGDKRLIFTGRTQTLSYSFLRVLMLNSHGLVLEMLPECQTQLYLHQEQFGQIFIFLFQLRGKPHWGNDYVKSCGRPQLLIIIVKWKVSGRLWEKREKEKIIEPHKIAVKWLFMTSNRYKTTLMYIFVVLQRKSFAEWVSKNLLDSFAKPENVSQIGKNQNDKFLLINAWQESMKRLLTFTLSQSRDGKWNSLHLQPSLPPFSERKTDIFKQKGKNPEERSRPSLSKENTHTVFFCVLREFVIIAGELIISFIWIVEIPDWWKSL